MDPTDFRGQVGLQRKRILVAIVYCRKQMEQVRTAIKRWNSAHVKPCSYISGDYGLLFIQSDPDEENFSTKEELFDFLKDNSEAVRCFSSVTFRFTSIGFDGYHAGPAQMFKEMILGDAGADFDYVFQMEPDVFPVRPMWLHALSGIADDGVWVKGSPGLYFDSSEADASFISIVGGTWILSSLDHSVTALSMSTAMLFMRCRVSFGQRFENSYTAFRRIITRFLANIEKQDGMRRYILSWIFRHNTHRVFTEY